jgi:MTH538 TIR-like domain (DUF1863)
VARKVFYGFHYKPDNWRAATVRNIGVVEGDKPASDNDWESVTSGGDEAIKRWISGQMNGKTCNVVLVGANTANRKWINHEIIKAWDDGLGVVGICIHGLKNAAEQTSSMGDNPFDYIGYGNTGKKLSAIVKCYNPSGSDSQDRYEWISKHLADAVEEAIKIRKDN